jgi:hypothetical protein
MSTSNFGVICNGMVYFLKMYLKGRTQNTNFPEKLFSLTETTGKDNESGQIVTTPNMIMLCLKNVLFTE